MSIDPLHRDIISQVNDRLRQSRQKLDDWANRQTALLQRTVEEHTRHVQKDKENIQKRQVNTAQLKWQSGENQRIQEERLSVLNNMKAALESMQTQDEALQKQAEELNAQIAEAEKILEQQRKEEEFPGADMCFVNVQSENAKYVRAAEVDMTSELEAYSHWLGLRFDRMTKADGTPGIRMTFTNIDSHDAGKQFVAEVLVAANGDYFVGSTSPELANLASLLLEVNRRRDFGLLVRSIRRRFLETSLADSQ